MKQIRSRGYFNLNAAIIWVLFSPLLFAADIEITDGYVRETLPGTQNSAAYMKIKNHSDQDRVIVEAHSPKVTRVEMHTQDKDGTMMVMRPVSEVMVPAHGQFKFQPGGHHFMLIGIEGALKAGESLPFQLIFADGTQLNTSLPVQAIGGGDKSSGMKHHNHAMH